MKRLTIFLSIQLLGFFATMRGMDADDYIRVESDSDEEQAEPNQSWPIANLHDVPNDVWSLIIKSLSAQDIVDLFLVNKTLKKSLEKSSAKKILEYFCCLQRINKSFDAKSKQSEHTKIIFEIYDAIHDLTSMDFKDVKDVGAFLELRLKEQSIRQQRVDDIRSFFSSIHNRPPLINYARLNKARIALNNFYNINDLEKTTAGDMILRVITNRAFLCSGAIVLSAGFGLGMYYLYFRPLPYDYDSILLYASKKSNPELDYLPTSGNCSSIFYSYDSGVKCEVSCSPDSWVYCDEIVRSYERGVQGLRIALENISDVLFDVRERCNFNLTKYLSPFENFAADRNIRPKPYISETHFADEHNNSICAIRNHGNQRTVVFKIFEFPTNDIYQSLSRTAFNFRGLVYYTLGAGIPLACCILVTVASFCSI